VEAPPSCALPFSFCLFASYVGYSCSGLANNLLVTTWIARAREAPSRTDEALRTTRIVVSPDQTHLLRSPLHSIILVLIFFPVPPSTRQAAGPLTENLPHVCLSDREPVDLSLERPSPEEQSVVSLRVFCLGPLSCMGYSWAAKAPSRKGETA